MGYNDYYDSQTNKQIIESIETRLGMICDTLAHLSQRITDIEMKNNNKDDSYKDNDSYKEDDFAHVWKEIEKFFNFERVQKMMAAVDWRWFDVKGEIQIEDIKSHLKRLVKDVLESKNTMSCGGFTVEYFSPGDAAERDGFEREEGVWPSVSVRFIGEDWETFSVKNN